MFDFIVAQKRVEEKQACRFFHQIIDGIEVIHRNEITHRDLKPEVCATAKPVYLRLYPYPIVNFVLYQQNLLLKATPDGWVVKIVDFGLSNTHEVKCTHSIVTELKEIIQFNTLTTLN